MSSGKTPLGPGWRANGLYACLLRAVIVAQRLGSMFTGSHAADKIALCLLGLGAFKGAAATRNTHGKAENRRYLRSRQTLRA